MRKSVDTKKVQDLLIDLKQYLTDEQIGVKLERTAHTVYCWRKGLSTPSKGDYEMLKTLSNKLPPTT